ncbi:MAG: hypothetical protein WCE73_22020 [Candidatus Angelobacter sp.]
MKVPDKYDPKNTNEFGTFDPAMTKLLAFAAAEMQRKLPQAKKAQEEI